MSNLIVSLSPHAHGTDSVERNMYGVILALVPALLVSFFYFGISSAIVCLTSVAACMFFEWAITKYLLKKESTVLDGSAILTGLLLGFNLPSNLPVWIVLIGALVAIGVGNDLFTNTKSIKRIIAPSKNAYQKIDQIEQMIRENAEDRLILLMLGPTAKVVVDDLQDLENQIIDLGHIDSEYEWFKMGATHKVKLENKHTAEFNFDENINAVHDKAYENEIIGKIE